MPGRVLHSRSQPSRRGADASRAGDPSAPGRRGAEKARCRRLVSLALPEMTRRHVPGFCRGVVALALSGCGGGLPLLHPAHTLSRGEVRAGAGFSANAATGGLSTAVRDATNEARRTASPGEAPPGTDATYAKGAIVVASVAPGLAPIVGARVGVGAQSEGGLTYTGRSIRADLRRSFYLSPS